jgi:hypothetical protein
LKRRESKKKTHQKRKTKAEREKLELSIFEAPR